MCYCCNATPRSVVLVKAHSVRASPRCRYKPGINSTSQDLTTHYGTAILPTRPRKPRDKAKVEVGVLIIERYVLARLCKRRFFSLFELNAAIREIVVNLNVRIMRKLGVRRPELLETVERPALEIPGQPCTSSTSGPLPASATRSWIPLVTTVSKLGCAIVPCS